MLEDSHFISVIDFVARTFSPIDFISICLSRQGVRCIVWAVVFSWLHATLLFFEVKRPARCFLELHATTPFFRTLAILFASAVSYFTITFHVTPLAYARPADTLVSTTAFEILLYVARLFLLVRLFFRGARAHRAYGAIRFRRKMCSLEWIRA